MEVMSMKRETLNHTKIFQKQHYQVKDSRLLIIMNFMDQKFKL